MTESTDDINHIEENIPPAETSELLSSLKDKFSIFISDLKLSDRAVEIALEEDDKDVLQMELEDVEKLKEKFDEVYEAIITECRKTNVASVYFEDARTKFLLSFRRTKAAIVKVIKPVNLQLVKSTTKSETVSGLKLSKIEVKIFKDEQSEWPQWKAMYETFIHTNQLYKSHEKHQILRSRLSGEPYSLIEEIQLDETNPKTYDDAWKVLLDQYDDPLESVSRYLRALDSVPPKHTLKTLVTHFRANVTPLRMVFQKYPDIDIFSQFIIHSFLQKADKGTNLDWQRELQKKEGLSTFDDFIKFMQGRCKSYKRAVNQAPSTPVQRGKALMMTNSNNQAQQKKQIICLYCKQPDHPLFKCQNFKELSNNERFSFVKKKQICRKCLRASCSRSCKFTCQQCGKAHNTLIHINFNESRPKDATENQDSSTNAAVPTSEFNILPVLCTNSLNSDSKNLNIFTLLSGWVGSIMNDDLHALLATSLVEIVTLLNNFTARAILDNASQFNLISKSAVKKLNLVSKPIDCQIKGIELMTSSVSSYVTLKLKSCHSNFSLTAKFLIVDKIIDLIPSEHFSIDNWNFPQHLKLADPSFNVPQNVELLLGLSIFWKIIKPHFKFLGTGLPKLIATHFGWLVAGDMKLVVSDKKYFCQNFLISEQILAATIQKFWFLEETDFDNDPYEAIESENLFQKTTFRNSDGRFIVRLPFKRPFTDLGLSKSQAFKRFHYLEQKLLKNANLNLAYINCMQDYIDQGHMKEILNDKDDGYYLPHHGVLKESSTSTKLRVVFDASMRTTSNLSLNDCLMVGPTVQSDLFSILIRSRVFKYLISADITQMYRQILVHPEDTKFQKIFWRSSPSEPLKIYELTTVTFGIASAPYLATRCLNELANNSDETFSLAKNAILYDFYVDDVLTGSNTLSTAKELQGQLIKLLSSAGFELSKWCSNDETILQNISPAKLEKRFPMYFGNEHAIKTLGLIWIPKDDVFKIWVHSQFISHPTKRQVLSIISAIFDPLGFLGPVTVLAKLLMQQLWLTNNKTLDWDEKLPPDILELWINFASQLPTLNNLVIPRLALNFNPSAITELHGFCDASEKAYGAVIYLRTLFHNSCYVNLLCSKSKVAPKKSRPIAQLELCAAVLLSELFKKVLDALKGTVDISVVRLWSDNSTVLHWIYSNPSRWIVFVANRSKKIQSLTQNAFWDYVSSGTNPADILSRGLLPSLLESETNWWSGPNWLQSTNLFSDVISFKPSSIMRDCEARNAKKLFCATIIKNPLFDKFSTFTKLVRAVGWYYRFFMYLDFMGPFLTGQLLCFEIRNATTVLIKLVQREAFSEELKCLKRGENVLPKSSLSSLAPFLDVLEVIRVGGRLKESTLTFDQRFPVVLPNNHTFSTLLIKYEHQINFHAGPQLLGSTLRRKWWILSQNRAIKSCILKCFNCLRMKAETKNQFMANLPKARITPSKPFTICGLDYAGPIQLLKWKGCRNTVLKAYICLFVCFATKAIHLELVSELTTECFLAAFNRFISQRGIPLEINSDNATTFVGAAKKLQDLKTFLTDNNDFLIKFATNLNITWNFIPPRGPHFGGLWEAGIKSVKSLLLATLKDSKFTYEHYLTYLTQVEACLNSRPLTVESTDPNEPRALTPGHFLIGGPITALPNPDLSSVPVNRLKYWEKIQQRTQVFWKKWHKEYLNTLQQRSKWRQLKDNLKVGDIVIVYEDNLAPTQWPLAIISALHPNSDGLVRKVSIRMVVGNRNNLSDPKKSAQTAEFIRPIHKLVYLPTE